MTKILAPVSRRRFLSQLAAGSAVITTGMVAAPPSILAANDPENAEKLLDHYIAGLLQRKEEDRVFCYAEGYGPAVPVIVRGDTQVCAGSDCEGTIASLNAGDRIDAGTYFSTAGERVAMWINANPVAGWGTVDEIEGNIVYVSRPSGSGYRGRQVAITDYTTISTSDGEFKGSVDWLAKGDNVHYTGLSPIPDLDSGTCNGMVISVLYPGH